MHPSFLDQLHKGTQRVRRCTDDDSREVRGSLIERLTHSKVEGLIGTEANKSLMVVSESVQSVN